MLGQGALPDASGALGLLVASKPSVALPLIGLKIEEVLKSKSPLDLFTDKSVDPQRFVAFAAAAIEDAGNDQALREVGRLLRLDAERFDDAVQYTMIRATAVRNPFPLAYQGFAISDPALDTRLAIWAEWALAESRPPLPAYYLAKRRYGFSRTGPQREPKAATDEIRQLWAEALLDRYGGVPSDAQWQSDPIVSRLSASQAESLHNDMISRASEIVQKRVTR